MIYLFSQQLITILNVLRTRREFVVSEQTFNQTHSQKSYLANGQITAPAFRLKKSSGIRQKSKNSNNRISEVKTRKKATIQIDNTFMIVYYLYSSKIIQMLKIRLKVQNITKFQDSSNSKNIEELQALQKTINYYKIFQCFLLVQFYRSIIFSQQYRKIFNLNLMENQCHPIENLSQRPEIIHLGSRNRSKSPCFVSSNTQMNHSGSFISKSQVCNLQSKQASSPVHYGKFIHSHAVMQKSVIKYNQTRNLYQSHVDHSFRQSLKCNIACNQNPQISIAHKHARSPTSSIQNSKKIVITSPRSPLKCVNPPQNTHKLHIKLNSPVKPSIIKQNTFSPVSISLGPNQIISNVSQRQKQLLRKIKVLENRVAQLHQSKKSGLIQLQLQNQRLVKQINILKEDLNKKNSMSSERKVNPQRNEQYIKELKATIQTLKKENYQLQQKKNQIEFSRNLQEHIDSSKIDYIEQEKDKEISDIEISEINNCAYEEKIRETIDNLNIQQKKNEELTVQMAQLTQRSTSYKNTIQNHEKIIAELKAENQKIKTEYEQFKHQITQSSHRIQENQRIIVTEFQAQIQQYKNQIQALLCKINQENQRSIQIDKSQHFDVNEANHQLEEVIQNINKLECENHQLTNQKIIFQQRISVLSHQIISLQSQKCQIAEQNKQLLIKIQQLQAERTALQSKMNEKSRCSSSTQTCKKCQQMMRTVIKLNNYVNGKR